MSNITITSFAQDDGDKKGVSKHLSIYSLNILVKVDNCSSQVMAKWFPTMGGGAWQTAGVTWGEKLNGRFLERQDVPLFFFVAANLWSDMEKGFFLGGDHLTESFC